MNSDQLATIRAFKDKYNVPAVAAGVLSHDGQLDFEMLGTRYRGGEDQVQPQDQWHIGSCTKSMTAVLYARLVEQGQAEWGCSVGSLFPDLDGKLAAGWGDRTMEQLFMLKRA